MQFAVSIPDYIRFLLAEIERLEKELADFKTTFLGEGIEPVKWDVDYSIIKSSNPNSKNTAEELLNDYNRLKSENAKLQKVADLAAAFYKATLEWNSAVEKIIGRVPQTGIPIQELGEALSALEDNK